MKTREGKEERRSEVKMREEKWKEKYWKRGDGKISEERRR